MFEWIVISGVKHDDEACVRATTGDEIRETGVKDAYWVISHFPLVSL